MVALGGEPALGLERGHAARPRGRDGLAVHEILHVAEQMWNHFSRELTLKQGGPLFCDSCHAGKGEILNRADREGVKKFMESDYVGKLHRADKKPMECSTCHSDAMELDIFGKLWGVK